MRHHPTPRSSSHLPFGAQLEHPLQAESTHIRKQVKRREPEPLKQATSFPTCEREQRPRSIKLSAQSHDISCARRTCFFRSAELFFGAFLPFAARQFFVGFARGKRNLRRVRRNPRPIYHSECVWRFDAPLNGAIISDISSKIKSNQRKNSTTSE